MDLLGHEDFFVFLHSGTNQVNILYRRRDGTLGLIESEIG
jgi:putative sigma-54 modulation protein